MTRARSARPGSRDGRRLRRAALAVVLGFLALVSGHGFLASAAAADDVVVASVEHVGAVAHAPELPAPAAGPCVDCGATHHDAAVLCAVVLLVLVLLALTVPRGVPWARRSDRPAVPTWSAVPRPRPAPDLWALGISRT